MKTAPLLQGIWEEASQREEGESGQGKCTQVGVNTGRGGVPAWVPLCMLSLPKYSTWGGQKPLRVTLTEAQQATEGQPVS